MAKIYVSAVIDAPVDRVWAAARDFNGLPAWVPAVAKSTLQASGSSDSVGSVRELQLQDGGSVVERLLALSDHDHTCTYSILGGSLPVKDYVATFSFRPITDGERTFAEWSAQFSVTAGDEQPVIDAVANGVFGPAFARLNEVVSAALR